ncbi:MAG: Dipeptide transport system permease protein DppC, partial [uncultured Nocardioidaceae bacterium]
DGHRDRRPGRAAGRAGRRRRRREPVAGGLQTASPQPDGTHRDGHHGVVRPGGHLRAAARTVRGELAPVDQPLHAVLRAGYVGRTPARDRPLGLGHAHPADLRRPAVPGDRGHLHLDRSGGGNGTRRACRRDRRPGRHRGDALRGRHAVDSQPPACDQHRGGDGQELVRPDGRHRHRPGPDLRPAAPRLDARPEQGRLRHRGTVARATTPDDRAGARAAQLLGPDDRAGDVEPRHRHHRGGGAVLPRPRRRRPGRRRVGPDDRRRAGPVPDRSLAGLLPRHLHRRHGARVHAAGRSVARGPRPQAAAV